MSDLMKPSQVSVFHVHCINFRTRFCFIVVPILLGCLCCVYSCSASALTCCLHMFASWQPLPMCLHMPLCCRDTIGFDSVSCCFCSRLLVPRFHWSPFPVQLIFSCFTSWYHLSWLPLCSIIFPLRYVSHLISCRSSLLSPFNLFCLI